MIDLSGCRIAPKHRLAADFALDLLNTLDDDETNVTADDIARWRDDEIYDWLEAWGFEWDGAAWMGSDE